MVIDSTIRLALTTYLEGIGYVLPSYDIADEYLIKLAASQFLLHGFSGVPGSASSEEDSSFTISQSNVGTFIKCTNSSSITITVPLDSSEDIIDNSEIIICRYGAGAITFAGETGVTINSVDGYLDITKQFGISMLRKIGENEWLLAGYLG